METQNKTTIKEGDTTTSNPIVKTLWDNGNFLDFYKSYDGDIERATLVYEGCLIVIGWNCYIKYPTIEKITPLKEGNIEGLSFPICKTSYKRVIIDLEKRNFILFKNKFLSKNYILNFKLPRTEYSYKYPTIIKGEITLK